LKRRARSLEIESSISISGPSLTVVNGVFLEVKRDSQLLETSSQPKGPSKEPLNNDKNIYDELRGLL